jgi:hypothetical protein
MQDNARQCKNVQDSAREGMTVTDNAEQCSTVLGSGSFASHRETCAGQCERMQEQCETVQDNARQRTTVQDNAGQCKTLQNIVIGYNALLVKRTGLAEQCL